MSTTKKIQATTTSIVGLLVVLAIAIAVNVILGNFNIRKDLTEEQIYTLSDGTKTILKKLEVPVTLKLYVNSSDASIPMPIKYYAKRVEDLLAEYKVAGGGKIIIEKFDPEPDSKAEDRAKSYGIIGQSMGFMGPTIYFGIVAAMGETDSVMPIVDPRTDSLLEYNITRMITRVTSPRKPVIGVWSGLPMLGANPGFQMPGQPPPAPAWVVIQEMKQDYEVRELDPSSIKIADDIDALMIVHPKQLPDEFMYAVDQFVLRGGRLVLFLDAFSKTESERAQSPQMRFTGNSSSMPKLLAAWGVTFNDKQVVADLEAPTMVQSGNKVEENPAWLSFRKKHFNQDAILTAQLDSMMMPFAGTFTIAESSDIEVTPLITTSETSCMVDSISALYSISSVRRDFKSGLKKLNVAAKLHGKFKTAFPEGEPGKKPDAANSVGDSLKESTKPTSIFLIGDADMLFDLYCVKTMDFMGYQMNQPRNDNLSFAINMVDQAAGSADLSEIRTRGKSNRPFEKVLQLERLARERHLQEETMLQKKLEDAQQRINELQRQKDKSQMLTLSPQQKAEQKRFENEVTETRKQLTLVRRKLREDIEKLGMNVKAINILLMPVLVSIIGVCFAYYRKRKTKS